MQIKDKHFRVADQKITAIPSVLDRLQRDFRVTNIDVYADNSICLNRVKTRDQTIHINVSDEQVLMINDKVKGRQLQTDFVIHNEAKTKEELIIELRRIITPS